MKNITYCHKHQTNCIQCNGGKCITQIPLLSNLNSAEIDKIAEGVKHCNFKNGDRVFSAGDIADRLFIVCSGKMKIYKNTIDGREQILYILSSGDFIGAFNLLKEDEFEFNAEAIEDLELSTLAKEDFDQIILSNPRITLKVFEKAYERIMKVESLVDRLSTNSTNAKVAGLLLSLIRDFGHETPEGIVLELTINREEMGSYSGISRETMTRKLKTFSELQLIELRGHKKIIIKNKKGLQELLQE